MQNITIKKKFILGFCLLCLSSTVIAQSQNSTSPGVGSPHAPAGYDVLQAPKKKIELKKDKKGRFIAEWGLFRDYDAQKKKVGKDLNKIVGKNITIKGFMIPLDYTAKTIKEFLLVPYVPSCAHVPPPPENMIITVTMNKKNGIKPSYYPVEVAGKLKFVKSKKKQEDPYLPNGVFSLAANSIKEVKN